MVFKAKRINPVVMVGHVFSGIGYWYIVRQAYRGFNAILESRKVGNDLNQNSSHVQPVGNDLNRNSSNLPPGFGQIVKDWGPIISYWDAAHKRIDIDPDQGLSLKPAVELAKIEHIIRMRGESAKSMTLGEMAEELKEFRFLWGALAEDVKTK